jgi:DnaJ domain
LLHEEALAVLALDPGATAAEIKESYRDLVKVWHPDRFGSDPRLRRKAEEKLRQINDAYRVLQSPKPDFTRVDAEHPSYAEPSAASRKYGTRSSRIIIGWILGGFGIAVLVIAAMIALTHDSPQTQASVAPEIPPQSTGVGNHAGSSPQKAQKAPLKDASSLDHATAQFRVRQLSDAEAAQLESVCPKAMELRDPSGYQDCLRAQLEPSAPDMSALSAEDRAGIESACRRTKMREDSAAYNRCLTRMVKLLNDSSHS